MTDVVETPAVAPVEAPTSDETQAPAPESTTTPKVEPKADKGPDKRKYKLKVNEKEEEVELTDEEIVQHLQKAKGADAKFQEAATYRKQAEQLVRLLKEDPIKLLSNPALGHDIRKLAEDYLIKQMEEDALSPEAKELKSAKARLAEIDAREKADKEENDKQQLITMEKEYSSKIQAEIIQVLETAGLPKSQSTVRRMAQYLHKAIKNNIKVDTKDVVELVRRDYINEIKDLFGTADGETLIKLLGEDTATKIRKFDVEKLKKGQLPRANKGSSNPDEPRPAPKEKKMLTPDELHELIEEKIRNSK